MLFIIDKTEAMKMEGQKFKDLGFSEKNDLQEWLRKNPDILGEKLLIIQKEFDEFEGSKNRLDLLALDVDGKLVVIENKLDDSGTGVTWQALQYVSFFSNFTKDKIVEKFQKYLGDNKKAEEVLCEFFDKKDFSSITLDNDKHNNQRIILVARDFRKEVTSTVMWLLKHGIDIKCVKVTPYKHEKTIFIDSEQILPPIGTEGLLVRVAEENIERARKEQADADTYFEFWSTLLPKMNEQSSFKNANPLRYPWISRSAGSKGIIYEIHVTNKCARISLYIDTGEKERNKKIFDNLSLRKNEIGLKFGEGELVWDRLDGRQGSRVAVNLQGVNVFEKADWDKMIEFFVKHVPKFEEAMGDELAVMKDIQTKAK